MITYVVEVDFQQEITRFITDSEHVHEEHKECYCWLEDTQSLMEYLALVYNLKGYDVTFKFI